uniref:Coniferyl alcohol 9-O-methyltransferase n=1 Tax=Linum album TaxID=191219 RepID=A6XNE7_LINAL|nr:coniferyl alcohol 9-O-methyltransferase [Linum album]ABX71749.1 S-adenosyl-L-methionine-dependent coniferyl alcohol 9-O-methyltransferase [Linum album]
MDAATAVELLNAQPQVWHHFLGYINSMTLQCALELEIADVIHRHGQPIPLNRLAAAVKIPQAKAPFLSRLMRMLVHLGYFTQVKHQQKPEAEEDVPCYWLAPLSRLLLKENPFNARSLTFCSVHEHLVDPWRQMSAWLRTSNEDGKDTANVFAFAHEGKKVYEVCSEDANFSQLFSEGMAGDSWLFSRALVSKCRDAFEGLSSLVDVGGGTGNTSKVIAEAFPNIHCTVFDLPHVVSGPKQTHPNLDYESGNMFTDDIPHADAVLFKWVLCDWPDEPVLKMLKQCKKALTKNGVKGKVMIADHVLGHESCNDSSSMGTSLILDLLFMSFLEGSLRTEKQWAKLFSEAGFADYKITPVGGLRVLIEVYP